MTTEITLVSQNSIYENTNYDAIELLHFPLLHNSEWNFTWALGSKLYWSLPTAAHQAAHAGVVVTLHTYIWEVVSVNIDHDSG
jgi:hypothetical protein